MRTRELSWLGGTSKVAALLAFTWSCSELGADPERSLPGGGGDNASFHASGAPATSPVADAGAATDDEPDGATTTEGGAASATGGAASATGGAAGEAVSLGGSDGEATPPYCKNMPEGTYCGSKLTPQGGPNVRYFCAEGSLLAQAECPGTCQAQTSMCEAGTGTGEGTGDDVLRFCPACYSGPCALEFSECDALCRAHVGCLDTCDLSQACQLECSAAFAGDPQVDTLLECARAKCATTCLEM